MYSIGWGQCTSTGSGTCTVATSITGTATWGGYYCVSSDITISGNLTVSSGSFLEMQGFRKITVTSTGTLSIDNTDIYGTTVLWDRITVQPGGSLTITGSRIQDGTYAVYAQNGASESFLNINGNVFCNNETAIYLNTITTATLLTTNIANNEIYAPALKGSGDKGDFGIYINEVKHISSGDYAVRIGTPSPYTGSSTFNYIHDVNIGIRAYRSSPVIQNNLITNILGGSPATLPAADAPYANTAIAASSVTSDVVSIQIGLLAIPAVYNNEIRNSTTGISCNQYVNTTITGNNIFGNVVSGSYSMSRGIYLYDNISTVTINSNRIEKFSSEGVYLDNLLIQGLKAISDNTIGTVSGFTSGMNPHGIRVRELVLSSSYVLTISNNTIDKVRNGIFTRNISRPTISGNIINFNSTGGSSTSCGIRSIECPEVSIADNIVIGDCLSGSCGGNVRSIMVEGCGAFVLNDNYVQYGSAGIWIQDNAILGNLYCNQIRDSFKGVMLYNLGIVGSVIGPVQSPLGGPSDNGWYPAATQNRVHTYPATLAGSSKWRYRNSDVWYDIPLSLTSFTTPATLPFFELVTGSYCDLPSLRLDGDDADYLNNKYSDWAMEYISDDAAYSATSYYHAWLFWNDVQSDESLMDGASGEIIAAYDAVNTSNIPAFYNVLAAIADRNYDEAAEINESITPDNDIEIYWQLTNAIYISSIADDGSFVLNDEDAETLSGIIDLNPQQYGFGVYNAWGMLDTIVNYSMEWEEEKIAYTNDQELYFYPNPASSIISFSANLGELDIINIYSTEGKLLLQKTLQRSNTLGISSLSPGMYIITIMQNEEVKFTDKLFIIKSTN